MNIRNARQEDLPRCVELLRLPELVFANGEYPDLEYLEIYLDSGLFFVAEKNSEVVGLIFGERVRGGVAMIWYFAVDINYRKRGIGRSLLSYFESECKKQGIVWAELHSPLSSIDSLRFYEAMGYDKNKPQVEFLKRL